MQHPQFPQQLTPLSKSHINIATKITTQNITILQSLFITFTGLFLIFLLVVIIILNFSLLLQKILLLLSNTGLALLEGQLLAVEPGKENLKFGNLTLSTND